MLSCFLNFMIKVQFIQQGALVLIQFQTEKAFGTIQSTLGQINSVGQNNISAFIIEELRKLELGLQ